MAKRRDIGGLRLAQHRIVEWRVMYHVKIEKDYRENFSVIGSAIFKIFRMHQSDMVTLSHIKRSTFHVKFGNETHFSHMEVTTHSWRPRNPRLRAGGDF